MILKLTTKYDIGTVVYLKVNPEEVGVVCGFSITAQLVVLYSVAWGDKENRIHYDFELTDEKPL